VISPALVRGADRLRRTLLPSLLEARAGNVAVGTADADLFEIARGYLARRAADESAPSPAEEPLLLACVAGGGFARGKGLAEAVLARLGVADRAAACGVTYRPIDLDLFARGRGAEIVLARSGQDCQRVGVVGEAAPAQLRRHALDGPLVLVELRLDRLDFAVDRTVALERPSDFPAVDRDLNLVVAAAVPWGRVETTIHAAAGRLLDGCRLVQVWEDAERLGAGKKSFLVALRLRSDSGTLSGEEAARATDAIVSACTREIGAELRR
jgi:phenylalanyl-tRNA synthetase beta chain